MDALVLLAHAAATLAMTGLIWFVQIVHYPLMAIVGTDRGVAYQRAHRRRTGRVVGPLMLVEAATALTLALARPETVSALLAWTGLALLAAIWVSTAVVQVPYHQRLERDFEGDVVVRLVRTNWLRTAAWTLRSCVALLMLSPLSA
jgi:hypothetical protein